MFDIWSSSRSSVLRQIQHMLGQYIVKEALSVQTEISQETQSKPQCILFFVIYNHSFNH